MQASRPLLKIHYTRLTVLLGVLDNLTCSSFELRFKHHLGRPSSFCKHTTYAFTRHDVLVPLRQEFLSCVERHKRVVLIVRPWFALHYMACITSMRSLLLQSNEWPCP